MLFNSFEFIFIFFPVTLVVYFLLGKTNQWHAAFWLALMSLIFYAWWDVRFLPLLTLSIIFNFWVGGRISVANGSSRKRWLVFGILADLSLIIYFKYVDFFILSANFALKQDFELLHLVLPIGISFFSFTQIAFLVDTWQGKVKEYRFVHYVLFVTYFPHLIAGPILHHKEMMPQFAKPETYRINWNGIAFGATLFTLGLAKKVLLADNLSPYVAPVFDSTDQPQLIEAWGAALAYTFQLYFDFSGYSDMALGLAKIFGVNLPINFNSPYKSQSIVDFWRRWHMTLSRFLRDYLYIPLGGSRGGELARYRNLMITMLLGGLWHGAGWTFVIWGALHGIYLAINHAWVSVLNKSNIFSGFRETRKYRMICQLLCFVAVVVAWVLFRASSLDRAMIVLSGMLGMNGISVPLFAVELLRSIGMEVAAGTGRFQWPAQAFWLVASGFICFFVPNTMEVLSGENRDLSRFQRMLAWRYSTVQLAFLATLSLVCLLNLTQVSEFLYFQF